MPSPLILGIHDGHAAGAALIRNGEVIAAISEERLRNIKNYSGVPSRAIKKVFEIANVSPEEVTEIAVACLIRANAPLKEENSLLVKIFHLIAPVLHGHMFTKFYVWVLHKMRKMQELNDIFRDMGIAEKPVRFVEHHLAHAACAYYQSPYNKEEEVLVLTLDGAGDGICASVNIGKDNRIKRIASTTTYNSPGNNLYSEITGYFGLKRWEHEYKVMGMAPYGRPEYSIDQVRKVVDIHPRKPLEFRNKLWGYGQSLQRKFRKLFAEQRFDNLSAACQQHFEELLAQWVKNAIEATGIHKIACAGGMFLNVKANKLLRELPEIEDVFFYPACDDSGTPVGAALEVHFRHCEENNVQPERHVLKDIYYGVLYADEEIAPEVEKVKDQLTVEQPENPERRIAELLSQGKIIARFNGRDEWGPRALGNRSIMADPRDLRVIRKINFAIKQRDFWMPFACSILEEDMEKYVKEPKKHTNYMIEAFDTTEKGEEIISGCHPFDMTVRPQMVNDWNPGWRKIIREFKNITGVGAILNTSFNLHGYPVVGNPEVAIDTFMRSGLDGMVIGKWVLLKK